MRISIKILRLLLAMAFIPVVYSCMDDTPPDHNDNPVIEKKDTQILPASPTTVDVVKIITNDCKYYVLASVIDRGKEITVKKRFNSQMKWPCVLAFDTISLGQLKQGDYSVLLLIIDTNPMVKDSIFSKETLALTVSK
jgi:hypothetical protein